MVTKAEWKKYGVNIGIYTPAQRKAYDREAEWMSLRGSRGEENIVKKARGLSVEKTVDGVKHYRYFNTFVPQPVHKAILRMATDELKVYQKLMGKKKVVKKPKKTAKKPKKTGRIKVEAHPRKGYTVKATTVKAHTRKRR